jgi:hypothetical protein
MVTVSETLRNVRAIIQDEQTPFRYSDTDLVQYLNEALAAMYRIRPDLMVGQGWAAEAPYSVPADAAKQIPAIVAEWYFSPLVDWISGRAFMRDTQYGEGGVAVVLFDKMRAALLTTGV